MKFPDRLPIDEVTEDYAKDLFAAVPGMAKYLLECVSDRGEEAYIEVLMTGVCGTRKWQWAIHLPRKALEGIEASQSDLLPDPKTTLAFLKPQRLLDPNNSEIVTKVEVKDE